MPRVTASRREPTPTGGGVSHRSSTADADQEGVFSGVGQDREHVRHRAGDDDPCVPFGHGTSLLAAQCARSARATSRYRSSDTPSAMSQIDHAT